MWRFRECVSCGHWYLDPRPTLTSIGRAYSRYYTHETIDQANTENRGGALRAAARSARHGYLNSRLGYNLVPASRLGVLIPLVTPGKATWMRRVVAYLDRPPTTNPRLLDVGAGHGVFVARMQALGWTATGIDVDLAAVKAGQAAGLDLRLGTAEGAGLAVESFDALVLDHSIEHLHDPVGTLAAARELLRPGGQISIATPNVHSAVHRAFGDDWVNLETPRHLSLFSESSLELALKYAGFVRIARERPPGQGTYVYRQSRTVAAGANPFDSLIPMTRGDRIRALRIDLLERLRPSRAEELNFTALRPHGFGSE